MDIKPCWFLQFFSHYLLLSLYNKQFNYNCIYQLLLGHPWWYLSIMSFLAFVGVLCAEVIDIVAHPLCLLDIFSDVPGFSVWFRSTTHLDFAALCSQHIIIIMSSKYLCLLHLTLLNLVTHKSIQTNI